MLEIIIGLICVILGGYQAYRTYKSFNFAKEHGNQNTSPFLPLALWSGIIFSFALIVMGISFVFNLI